LDNILKVNQRLEIVLSKNPNTPQFTSRVEELDSDHMTIAMPMKKGRPIVLESGQEFYGKIYDEGGVYLFKSKFISQRMEPLPVWVATLPHDIEKTQQRDFVRFDVAQPILINYSSYRDPEQLESLKVITKDLSGGGVQAVCEKNIRIGTKVHMIISLSDDDDDDDIEVDGEVLRVNKPQMDRQLFWISIKFIGARNTIRDKISRFIFKKQLEQRQRGL
jgi:c-di-GMP-binding flagellar brake protein YcgR